MHAGQHATALMGAIYQQQILQQQPAVATAAATAQPINGQPPQQLVPTQPIPQQLPVTRRERKLSRSEDGATLTAANGGVVGRSTEV